MVCDAVFDNQVGYSILKLRRPGEDALDACRIRRHHPDRREHNPGVCYIRIHLLKPFIGNPARACTHVCQNHRGAVGEMVDEGVQPRRGMDIYLRHAAAEEVRQRSPSLVFRVEIEQRHRNLIRIEPFGKPCHHVCFPDSALAAHRENDPLPCDGGKQSRLSLRRPVHKHSCGENFVYAKSDYRTDGRASARRTIHG